VPANNQSSATATVDAIRRELSIDKWFYTAPNGRLAGEVVTWRISYRNDGNVVEPNPVITDTLPSGVSYDPAYESNDYYSGWTRTIDDNIVTWTRDSLSPQASGNLYISGIIKTDQAIGEVLTNTVQLDTGSDATPQEDTNAITVEGPTLELNPTTLDLGTGYVGFPLSAVVEVGNQGVGPLLITGLSSSTPGMTFAPASLTVSPWSTAQFSVTLTAGSSGAINGNVEITSNASLTPDLLGFSALIEDPALIRLEPSEIETSQAVGSIQTVSATIHNDGTAALDWDARMRAGDVQLSAGPNVLLIHGGDGASSLQSTLQGLGGLGVVDTFDAAYGGTPSLAQLQGYDAIVIWNYNGYSDATLLGDNLADYVDGGGHVIVTYWALDSGYLIGGRWASGGYAPMTVGYYSGSTACLSTYDSGDPLFAGVTTALCDYSRGAGTALTSDAQQLALYDDGEILVAAKDDRSALAINAYPGNYYGYSGELPQLIYNGLIYLNESTWISVSPSNGSIAPGASSSVTLTLDASELVGGVYSADLHVAGNDPRGDAILPITATVVGTPVTRLESDTFDFGEMFVGGSAALTATLHNDGDGILQIEEVAISDPAISFVPDVLSVPAFGSLVLPIQVSPAALGPLNASITITTNDPVTPVLALTVDVVGVAAPQIHLDPAELSLTAGLNTTDTLPLILRNTGAYTLNWSLQRAFGLPAGPNAGSFLSDYRVSTSLESNGPTYEWIDISATGTSVTGLADDNFVGPFPIGFDFPYYDGDQTQFYIGSNGYIGFGPSGDYWSRFETALPDAGAPLNIIAWLWDDLNGAGSDVFYQTIADTLIVQFDEYGWYGNGHKITAQIWLKRSGEIRIQYRDFSAGAPVDNAVIGIQNNDGSEGVTAANREPFVQANLAVRIARLNEWLDLDPAGGQIGPGSSSTITASLNTAEMAAGDYLATVTFTSNDPVTPTLTLPVSLTLRPLPIVSLKPETIDIVPAFDGHPATVDFTVANDGNGPLAVSGFQVTDAGGGSGQVSPDSFTVAPFSAISVTVTYTPSAVGPFTATVTAQTDDLANPTPSVTLAGEAAAAPVLQIDAPSFNITQDTGLVTTRTLTLNNVGSGPLDFNLSRTNEIVDLTPITGTVAPGDSQVISVTVDTRTRSDSFYSGVINVNSNDPQRPLVQIPVNLIVILAPPVAPSSPSPANGEGNVLVDKTLLWQASYAATSYDVFLWKDGESKPASPTATGLTDNGYQHWQLLDMGEDYRWQVVARNIMGGVSGPEWTFTTEILPDLVVENLQAPSSGTSGQPLGVDFLVSNVGQRATQGGWSIYLYLSPAPVFDRDSAQYIGNFGGVYLGPDQSYPYSGDSRPLAEGMAGDFYLFVQADASNSQREGDEENNVARSIGLISIELAPTPDLKVNEVTGPANAFSGDFADVQWTVENSGATDIVLPFYRYGTVSSWTDYVYLSDDDAFDSSDRLLASRIHTETLAVGATYTKLAQVRLPNGISGDYHFIVRTDVNDRIYEHAGESNNTAASAATIDIALTPPPDFEVTAFNPTPAPSFSGETIELQWLVSNPGPGEPFQFRWQDKIFISDSSTLVPADATELATRHLYKDLRVGETYTETVSVRLPNGIQGDHYFHVWTDSEGEIFEFDDTNNTRTIGPFDIGIGPSPDLQILSAAPSTTTVQPGQRISVTWELANLGSAPIESWFANGIYLSTGPAWTPQSLELSAPSVTGGLAISQTYAATSTFYIPSSTELGEYYLHFRADKRNWFYEYNGETNNTFTIGAINVVSPAGQNQLRNDLVVQLREAPSVAETLEEITVTWTVTNDGYNATSNNDWYDALYLSHDQVLDEYDTRVVEQVHYGTLEPGEVYTATATFKINRLLEGDYYWIVETDNRRNIADGYRDNNVDVSSEVAAITATPPGDLIIEAIDPPLTAIAGQEIDLSWLVRNIGDGDFDPTNYVGVYLSYNQNFVPYDYRSSWSDVFYSQDYPLLVEQVPELSSSAFYTDTGTTRRLPSEISGRWHLLFIANFYAVAREYDGYRGEDGALENNIVAVPITVVPQGPSDLVVTEVTGTSQAGAGETITVAWTLENQGESHISARWRDVVFLSADPVWDPSDTKLGEARLDTRYDHLAPNNSIAVSLQVDLPDHERLAALQPDVPGVTPGSYYYIVRSDIYNAVYETDEENNSGISATPLSIDLPVINLGESITGTSESGQLYFRLPIETAGAVRITVDSESAGETTQVYVRYGQMATPAIYEHRHGDPVSADQTVIIPLARPGDYYLALRNGSPSYRPTSLSVSILAEQLDFSILASSPAQAGNAAPTMLHVEGALFTGDTVFELVGPSGAVLPTRRSFFEDSSNIYATFDLDGAALGSYDLRAQLPSGVTATLEDALVVVAGTGPEVIVDVQGPDRIRPGRTYLFYISYANKGDGDAVAPLLVLRNPNDYLVGLDPTDLQPEQLQFLGIGKRGPAGILRAGESHSIPVFFQAQADSPEFRIQAITPENANIIDWAALEPGLRPEEIPIDVWNDGWPVLLERLGETWGAYDVALAETATLLSQRGQRLNVADDLFTALFRQALGYENSVIGGQVIDVTTGQFVIGETVTARAEIEQPDGTIEYSIEQGITDEQGRFLVVDLPAATYELLFDNYYVDESQQISYTVDAKTDALGLSIEVYPIPGEVVSPPPNNVYESPQLLDVEGVAHMVYVRNAQIYHAVHDGNGWGTAAPIEGAIGSDPLVLYDATLIDGNDPGLMLIFEATTGTVSSIRYTVARQNDGTWEWSDVETYVDTSVEDINPRAVVDSNSTPLVVWQSLDTGNVEDDSDLYFGHSAVLAQDLTWADLAGILVLDEPQTALNMSLEAGTVIGLGVDGNAYLLGTEDALLQDFGFSVSKQFNFTKLGIAPRIIPIIGGKNQYSIVGGYTIQGNASGASGSGNLTSKLELFDGRMETASKASIGAEWGVDSKTCKYEFQKATYTGEMSISQDLPLSKLGYLGYVTKILKKVSRANIEVGVNATGSLGGTLTWKTEGGAWPEGAIDVSVSFGPYGKISTMDGEIEGKVTGSGNGKFTIDAKSFGTSDLYVNFETALKIGPVTQSFSARYPGSAPQSVQITAQSIDDAFIQVMDGLSISHTVSLSAKEGTSAVYDDSALLSSVSGDFVDDGIPTLTVDNEGLVHAIWKRESAAQSGLLGNNLYHAVFDGSNWHEPTEIAGTYAFNGGSDATIDATGSVIVVWERGDTADLSWQSDAEVVLEAILDTDLWYMAFDGNEWTTPTPLVSTEGSEHDVRLQQAAGWYQSGLSGASQKSDGEDDKLLYCSQWNGASWSAPVLVSCPPRLHCRNGAWLEIGGMPTLFWVQAVPDGDNADDLVQCNLASTASQWIRVVLVSS
jgi:uncharacterized repeat protein (TIGR01451 family)